MALLKVINDRPLFIMFLRSQRKFLETKGIINQFTKMDVKKFKELMKFTLANHSDWPKWKKGLFETFRDYSGIPALWHVAYERLWTLEGHPTASMDPRLAGHSHGSGDTDQGRGRGLPARRGPTGRARREGRWRRRRSRQKRRRLRQSLRPRLQSST